MEHGGNISMTTLSQPDVNLLKNAIAAGIANYIVERVSKTTEIPIDDGEEKRYPPATI